MKKKRLLSLVLAVTMLFGSAAAMPESVFVDSTSITASAYEDLSTSGKCGKNVFWSFKDGVLTISGKGKMYPITSGAIYHSDSGSYMYKRERIKSVVIRSGITNISDAAFWDCSNLTDVIIPNTVKTIDSEAFRECKSLKSITIPDSVTKIGSTAFEGCKSLSDISIPSSVTSIGGGAFTGTQWLKDQLKKNIFVVVNGTLIQVDSERCKNDVTIPSGIKSIGPNSFMECHDLLSVTIPFGVTSIGDSAFNDCYNLTTITLPESITSIGDRAFWYCTSLERINIPDSVKSIGKSAFYETQWLYDQQNKNPFVVVNGILIDGKKCSGNVIVPSSVTSIGDSAFSGCTSLTSVTIPNSVTSIGDFAFTSCEKLAKVTIPGSVTSIGDHAFYDCTRLTSVTIPGSVTSIGDYAFTSCEKLAKVTIPSSVSSIGYGAFEFTNWLKIQQKKSPFVVVNGILIDGQMCSGNITIPNSVTKIGEGAFSGGWFISKSRNITSVTIPNGVTSIGKRAFEYCTNLTSVTIPNSVRAIEEEAFLYCDNLKEVTIPEGVKVIGDYSFGFSGSDSNVNSAINSDNSECLYEAVNSSGLNFVKGFTIKGYKDTAAENYAEKVGIKFVALMKTKRFAGTDRAETATLISNANKGGMYKTANTVVIATGFDFHDALAAVPLASAYNAPLLLADRDNLSAKTLAEIKRLKAKNIIVVASTNAKDQNGKSAAIGKNVYKQLSGYKVTKIVGSSYYETTKKVAQQLQKKTGKAPNYVFITTVNNYADALSVSPVAAALKAPIMYVDPKAKPNANTTYYLNSVKSSLNKIFIIGGVNAVSKDVVAKIKAVIPNKTVQRFAGSDRYETCLRINNAFKSTLTGKSVCVAKGYNFPDALAGGVFAAKLKAPLFLADMSGNKATISNNQSNYLKAKNPGRLYVFGGQSAVPAKLVKTIAKESV